MNTSEQRGTVRIELSARSMLAALGLAAATWLAIRLSGVLLAVVGALVLAGTIMPVVEFVEKRGVRRALAVVLVFVALAVFAASVALVTVPVLLHQLSELMTDAPALQVRLARWLSQTRLTAPLAHSVLALDATTLVSAGSSHVLDYSSRALTTLAYVSTSLVLALYMVADPDRIRAFTYTVVPRAYHLRLARIVLNLESIVGGYTRGQLITSLAMSVYVCALLTIFRVPNAAAIGAFAGFADVVPFIGGLLVLTPAVASAWGRGPVTAIVVLIAIIVYQEIENRVLVPRVYGRALRLPPIAVVLALVVGGELLGVLGALLALPIAAGLRMIVEELRVAMPGDDTDDSSLRARDAIAEKAFASRTAGAAPDEAAVVATEIAVEIHRVDLATRTNPESIVITDGGAKAG